MKWTNDFDLESSRGRISQWTDNAMGHIYNTKPGIPYYGMVTMPYPAVCLVMTERGATATWPLFIRTWVVI